MTKRIKCIKLSTPIPASINSKEVEFLPVRKVLALIEKGVQVEADLELLKPFFPFLINSKIKFNKAEPLSSLASKRGAVPASSMRSI